MTISEFLNKIPIKTLLFLLQFQCKKVFKIKKNRRRMFHFNSFDLVFLV